jgi:hypothetical protein
MVTPGVRVEREGGQLLTAPVFGLGGQAFGLGLALSLTGSGFGLGAVLAVALEHASHRRVPGGLGRAVRSACYASRS